ncbi:DNA-3-methyladenine glycosylase family protein [Microbacterium murale]|uniref:3-methyladenine DNA glycosylase/8-oxoguanine DNA glycosylase n=1 Tax=Microbacterium murale TaxID=1081040 RepID=A0ABU0PAQ2_9MICO|nr:DNA-3-methyladenine glycosylase 2 family protein [Microbacterium murale]MDQ0644415.1 3-methyladenine DNA glycosylase/8-oxoguanine DNA glycosylase [Microbacterium murale]
MTKTADATTAAAATEPPRSTTYRPAHPLHLYRTVGVLMRGPKDPTMLVDGTTLWRASRTPEGVATLALRQSSDGIHATAWGPGADWALTQLPALCGADDDANGFDASTLIDAGHPFLADVARRTVGTRLTRTDLVFDSLASAVIEQKVTSFQAFGAWRALITRFGERAPGPTPRPMFAPPTIEGWRLIPSWAWHRAGVEPPQSRAIVRAAERGQRISDVVLAARTGAERDRILTSLPGIGAWTSSETRIRALGDPDAVSVGDYHLAHEVGFALTGSRVDDDGMLALLAPWAGHRHRVIRLILASGVREDRRGPRLAPEDHRRR